MKTTNEAAGRQCATCETKPRSDRLAADSPLATRAVERSPEESTEEDPFCLDSIDALLRQGERMLSAAETSWLLDEAYRLLRAQRAFDARVAELEGQLKAKEADYTGVCLEYADLSDENSRLKQELEINRIVLDARGRTLLALQQQLDAAACEGK